MKRLGIVGTMVWDTIHGRDPAAGRVEEWGGIAYALAGLESALGDDWEMVPLIKVGRDTIDRANAFLHALTRRSAAARFIEVPEPNNQVTLHYESLTRRTEHLSGGVPGWRWEELGPLLVDLDALYVNFISGFELDLPTMQLVRRGFPAPIYADLHSLLLGVGHGGRRTPRGLPDWPDWFACFDAVQLNEDEVTLLGAPPMELAAIALNAGIRLLVVTVGAQGTVYFLDRPFTFARRPIGTVAGPIETGRIAPPVALDAGDTTGCGDVVGATLAAGLLRGIDPAEASAEANVAAARNVTHRGATNLQFHLRGEIAPR